jgi:hypothetical protein
MGLCMFFLGRAVYSVTDTFSYGSCALEASMGDNAEAS